MKKSKIFSLFAVILFLAVSINAQELSVGADLVSRYIWRGADVGGNLPAIQPSVGIDYSGLSFGIWGSNPLSAVSAANSEIDFTLGYAYATDNSGEFSLAATDYYYPEAGIKMGNFDDKGLGAHTVEVGIGYTGPESAPISIYAGMNVYNDPGNLAYFQLGYSASVKDVTLDIFAGATQGSEKNTTWYGPSKFAVINVGLTASKDIKITDDFSLPVFGSWILNPYSEISYFAFGVSL